MDSKKIFRDIETIISENPEGITPGFLILKILKQNPEFTRNIVRNSIRVLTEKGVLMYQSRLGQTVITININKDVKISEIIRVSPPWCKNHERGITIKITPGSAFGNGIHPTTRICLKLIEHIFESSNLKVKNAIDIGTGTGILAIAALKLGADFCIATDLDSCALSETKINCFENKIEPGRIKISEQDIDSFECCFDLVIANLRYPTLINMATSINNILNLNGYVVLSGMRPDEKKMVMDCYGQWCSVVEEMTENHWSGLLIKKSSDF